MANTPSTAAQIIVTIIPIVGIVMGSVVLFLYLIFSHKEKMNMIERGIIKKTPFDIDIFSLLTGLLLFCIGFSLTMFFIFKSGFGYGVLSGLIPLSTGFSLLIFYGIRRNLK